MGRRIGPPKLGVILANTGPDQVAIPDRWYSHLVL